MTFCSYYAAEQDAQEYMHSGYLPHNDKITDTRHERRRFWLGKQEQAFFFFFLFPHTIGNKNVMALLFFLSFSSLSSFFPLAAIIRGSVTIAGVFLFSQT